MTIFSFTQTSFLLILPLLLLFHLLSDHLVSSLTPSCDFSKYSSGCEDDVGTYCNTTINECQCKIGFTIHVNEDRFCLPPRNISETCFLTAQCVQLARAKIGCFTDDRELVSVSNRILSRVREFSWLQGRCSCQPGFYLNSFEECVGKKLFNAQCVSTHECLTPNSYCDHFTSKCKCKPRFRFSPKRNRCVAQLIGETCLDDDHCLLYDSNAQCRVGGCQCKSSYILSSNGKCVLINPRGLSHNLLMILIIIGTAIIFALLSTVHKKWSASEVFYHQNNIRSSTLHQIDRHNRLNNINNNHLSRTPSSSTPSSLNPLSVPSLAMIWPLSGERTSHSSSHQSRSHISSSNNPYLPPYLSHSNLHTRYYIESRQPPPSYAEAVREISQEEINNSSSANRIQNRSQIDSNIIGNSNVRENQSESNLGNGLNIDAINRSSTTRSNTTTSVIIPGDDISSRTVTVIDESDLNRTLNDLNRESITLSLPISGQVGQVISENNINRRLGIEGGEEQEEGEEGGQRQDKDSSHDTVISRSK